MMVRQIRHIFEVTDVMQLRIVCGYGRDGEKCNGEMLYQFGSKSFKANWRCPRCGESWLTEFPDAMPMEMRRAAIPRHEAESLALLRAIDFLAGTDTGCSRFDIRFEIDGEEGKTA